MIIAVILFLMDLQVAMHTFPIPSLKECTLEMLMVSNSIDVIASYEIALEWWDAENGYSD